MIRTSNVLGRISGAALFACISLMGCQAMMYGTGEDMNRIQIGMSRVDVVSALGQPMTRGADAAIAEERLTYKRMAYTLGWSPTLYDVVLKEGKVVRFGAQP